MLTALLLTNYCFISFFFQMEGVLKPPHMRVCMCVYGLLLYTFSLLYSNLYILFFFFNKPIFLSFLVLLGRAQKKNPVEKIRIKFDRFSL